ncbi:Ca(2+)-dependent cysteine protease [Mycoemilia scoparia]|uniref:Ca(2+)-dependent cysteine protease n=1 Tax=Mycoemilia scoparia TaxID=417184 RepID=A0A9W8A2H3_9FUNG|nr:Ca(2+)-dependent cysteine protease [Mycoemilia scoparia]
MYTEHPLPAYQAFEQENYGPGNTDSDIASREIQYPHHSTGFGAPRSQTQTSKPERPALSLSMPEPNIKDEPLPIPNNGTQASGYVSAKPQNYNQQAPHPSDNRARGLSSTYTNYSINQTPHIQMASRALEQQALVQSTAIYQNANQSPPPPPPVSTAQTFHSTFSQPRDSDQPPYPGSLHSYSTYPPAQGGTYTYADLPHHQQPLSHSGIPNHPGNTNMQVHAGHYHQQHTAKNFEPHVAGYHSQPTIPPSFSADSAVKHSQAPYASHSTLTTPPYSPANTTWASHSNMSAHAPIPINSNNRAQTAYTRNESGGYHENTSGYRHSIHQAASFNSYEEGSALSNYQPGHNHRAQSFAQNYGSSNTAGTAVPNVSTASYYQPPAQNSYQQYQQPPPPPPQNHPASVSQLSRANTIAYHPNNNNSSQSMWSSSISVSNPGQPAGLNSMASVQQQPAHNTNNTSFIDSFVGSGIVYNPQVLPASEAKEYQNRYSAPSSKCTGTKRAVIIAINYFGRKYSLSGVINQVLSIKEMLIQYFGFESQNIVALSDNPADKMPATYENIKHQIKAMIKNSKPDDSLFIYYGGLGWLPKEAVGENQKGYAYMNIRSNVMFPMDFEETKTFTTSSLNRLITQKLPRGTRMTIVLDSTRMFNPMGLPLNYTYQENLLVPRNPPPPPPPAHTLHTASNHGSARRSKSQNRHSIATQGSQPADMQSVINSVSSMTLSQPSNINHGNNQATSDSNNGSESAQGDLLLIGFYNSTPKVSISSSVPLSSALMTCLYNNNVTVNNRISIRNMMGSLFDSFSQFGLTPYISSGRELDFDGDFNI